MTIDQTQATFFGYAMRKGKLKKEFSDAPQHRWVHQQWFHLQKADRSLQFRTCRLWGIVRVVLMGMFS